jgi:hypothetical protein
MRLPLLVVTGGAAIAALLVRLLSPWHPAFFSGVLVGAALGMAVWIWDDPPEVIAKWGRGAEGERRTAKAIRSLKRNGWNARHDLQGKYGNLDHVVFGPGGVFLLDSKNLSGTIRIEEGVFTVHFEASPINDYSLTHLPRWMHGAASGLRGRLQEQLGWIVDVDPVVVVCGSFPQRVAQCDGVVCVAVDALADWLVAQPRRLSDGDRAAVASAINDLPSAHAIAADMRRGAPKGSNSRT